MKRIVATTMFTLFGRMIGRVQSKNLKASRTTFAAVLVFSCALIGVAQDQGKPLPDRWHGFIIDQSTTDDVIKTLGAPVSDKNGSLKSYPLDKRISTRGKVFRHLEYKNVAGMDSADLVFVNDKLVSINLALKNKIPAGGVPNIYGLEFEPKISGLDQKSNPDLYERHQGKLYPKKYPLTYHLIAVTDKTFISAFVDNGGVQSILFGTSRGSTGNGAFPGNAKTIQIISRSLENREGADVLK